MERLYENKGFARRQNISTIVLVVVVIYGFFELYVAFGSEAGDSTSAMFGVLFVGGGIYGAKTIWDEGRDLVIALDADSAAGTGTVTLWRPFRDLTLVAPLAGMTGWRHFVKVGKRNTKMHYLVFSAPGYPRPLQIEMRPGEPVPDALRRLAGPAIAEYEVNAGLRPPPDDDEDA